MPGETLLKLAHCHSFLANQAASGQGSLPSNAWTDGSGYYHISGSAMITSWSLAASFLALYGQNAWPFIFYVPLRSHKALETSMRLVEVCIHPCTPRQVDSLLHDQ